MSELTRRVDRWSYHEPPQPAGAAHGPVLGRGVRPRVVMPERVATLEVRGRASGRTIALPVVIAGRFPVFRVVPV